MLVNLDLKILDEVISSIVNDESNTILYSSFQKSFTKIPKKEFNEIISKLEKDGFILTDNITMIDQKIDCIYSTFDGRILSNPGGYTAQYKRDQKTIPLHKLKTGLINAAALAAGIYYSLEIIRIYLLPIAQHICSCHFVWQK